MLQKKPTPQFGLALTLAASAAAPLALGVQSAIAQSAFPVPASLPKGTVTIDGSGSMAVANQSLKQQFESKFAETKVEERYNGSKAAIQAVLEGKADIAALGRGLTAEERAKGLVAIPVAREKIAIVVPEGSPFKGSLTIDQFAKIFRGQVTNWSQVGGGSGAIRLVDRPSDNDTRNAFKNYPVFKGAPLDAGANAVQLNDDSAETLGQNIGSEGVGYTNVSLLKKISGVRAVDMHKTQPTDPRYPFSQSLVYVYKADTTNPAVKAFLGFAGAPEGQTALKQAGFTDLLSVSSKETLDLNAGVKDGIPAAVSAAAGVAAKPDSKTDAKADADAKPGADGKTGADAAKAGADGKTDADATKTGADAKGADSKVGADGQPKAGLKSETLNAGKANKDITAPGAEGGGLVGDLGKGNWDWLWWLLLPLLGLLGLWLLFKGSRRDDRDRSTDGTEFGIDRPHIDGPHIDGPHIDGLHIDSPHINGPDVGGALRGAANTVEGAVNATTGAVGDAARSGGATIAGGAAAAGAAAAGAWSLFGGRKDEEESARPNPEASSEWGLDLPDVNLPDVNLPNANLPDVNLPDVNLPDVNLPNVNVPGSGLVDRAGQALSGLTENAGAAGAGAVAGAGAAAAGAWSFLSGKAKDAKDKVGDTASGLIEDGKDAVSNLAGDRDPHVPDVNLPNVGDTAKGVTNRIGDAAQGVTNRVGDGVSKVGDMVGNVGQTVTQAGGTALAGGAAAAGAAAAGARSLFGGSDRSEAVSSVDCGEINLGQHGESQLVLMPRGPQWAYAYWDIPTAYKDAAKRQGGRQMAVRLYDVTNIDFTHQPAHSMQQFECGELAQDLHIPIPRSDRDYLVEVGYIGDANRWLPMVRSTHVRVPSA